MRPSILLFVLAVAAACGRSAPAGDSAAARPADTASDTAAVGARPDAARRDTALARCAEPGRDSLCFHAERAYDFAGDGRPFTIVVDARGATPDSVRVALRVVRDGATLYRDDWSSAFYAKYDAAPVTPDSARRRASTFLARLLGDSAFRPTRAFLGGASDVGRMLREAIGFDVRVDAERRRLGLTPADTLPVASAQSPPPTSDSARVRALATELLDAPAFRYYAGGEATYAIAWSRAERRFVVVFACC